jgi:hypothetical protein
VFPLADHREATKELLKLKSSQLQPAQKLAGCNISTTESIGFRRSRHQQKGEGPTGVDGCRLDPGKSPLEVCVEESGGKAAIESMDSVQEVRSVDVNLIAKDNGRASVAGVCDNKEEDEANHIEKERGTGVDGCRLDPGKSPLEVCVEESGGKAAIESMDSVQEARSVDVNLIAKDNGRASVAGFCDNREEDEANHIEKERGIDSDIHICEDPEFANALSLLRPLADNSLLPIESEYYSQKIEIIFRLIKHES